MLLSITHDDAEREGLGYFLFQTRPVLTEPKLGAIMSTESHCILNFYHKWLWKSFFFINFFFLLKMIVSTLFLLDSTLLETISLLPIHCCSQLTIAQTRPRESKSSGVVDLSL